MHLSLIAIGFQIIVIWASHTSSANIYSSNLGRFSADITPGEIPRHVTRYETEKNIANRDYGNLKWFRRTVSNGITTLGNKIGSSRDTLTERQGFAGPFFVPFAVGSIIFSVVIAMQVQEALSRSSNIDNADCTFNAWGPCSRTCGGGIQTRDFTHFAKNGGAPCIGPTLNYCNPQACPGVGAAGVVVGQVVVGGGGGGKKRRRRKRQTKAELQPILKAAFCDNIPAGSIVPGSCDLQVLAYDETTGVCDYLLTFDILDATALETSLNDINDNIATNTAITDAGFTASPGTIGSPTTSSTPCPGGVALGSDGTCPEFMCDADDACKNDGTCDNGSCTCNNGFSGIDCTLDGTKTEGGPGGCGQGGAGLGGGLGDDSECDGTEGAGQGGQGIGGGLDGDVGAGGEGGQGIGGGLGGDDDTENPGSPGGCQGGGGLGGGLGDDSECDESEGAGGEGGLGGGLGSDAGGNGAPDAGGLGGGGLGDGGAGTGGGGLGGGGGGGLGR